MEVLTKQTAKIFWQHSKKYPIQIGLLCLGAAVVVVFQVVTPILYKNFIDILVQSPQAETLRPIFIALAWIIGMDVGRSIIWRAILFVNNFFQPRVMADLSMTCYKHLQKHSYGFFSGRFVGSLVTKVKRYERAFEQIADQIFLDLGRISIEILFIIGVLLVHYRIFGIIMISGFLPLIIFIYFFTKYKIQYDIKRAEADTEATAQLADSITNNINIKLFANYDHENKLFSNAIEKQFRMRKKTWDLGNIAEIVQSVVMLTMETLIMYLAIKMWQAGTMSIGEITLMQAYFFRIIEKLWNTGKNIQKIYEAVADANEMTELLLKEHGVKDRAGAKELEVTKGKIHFENVSFGYHTTNEILENFNLTVQPGERVALIGSSGGGKSTITKLLLRFYDLKEGAITIDGQNINAVTQDSLRSNVSFVPQDTILFHRSLKENIRYAKPDATDEEVILAAKRAHAHEFIQNLEHGYDTLVGERGIKLSGGERQRVAIARAILKDAPILVLDEATSSLDSESEMFIQDALTKLMKNRTTIVIAHRLSTIMQMDRIVVIADGKIIEEGKHEELLKVQQGTYQKLWDIQAGGFAAGAGA